ncbi:MAG: hypothetical protein FD145_1635, partial [Candidatus Saganbacteria bacterium]
TTGPNEVDNYQIGPTKFPAYDSVLNSSSTYQPYSMGSIQHQVRVADGNVYYKKGSISGYDVATIFPGLLYSITPTFTWGTEAKITNQGNASNPAITVDNKNNAFVAWEASGKIYFQKVPSNFAPVSSNPASRVQSNAVKTDIIITTQTSTLEPPTLITPTDGKELQTTRPTFEWKAQKDIFNEYRVMWSQLPNAEGDGKATKMNSSGAEKPTETGIFYFAHKLDPVFDPALERNKTYFWKVVGIKPDVSKTEVQSTTINSFTCNPPFEISGITNYPNPFDPNKEKTKIRYKLSKDADSVTIRIYDLAGSLVNELSGAANGEGASIWTKYNDTEWDGKNGRGDMVINGISVLK